MTPRPKQPERDPRRGRAAPRPCALGPRQAFAAQAALIPAAPRRRPIADVLFEEPLVSDPIRGFAARAGIVDRAVVFQACAGGPAFAAVSTADVAAEVDATLAEVEASVLRLEALGIIDRRTCRPMKIGAPGEVMTANPDALDRLGGAFVGECIRDHLARAHGGAAS